VNRQALRVFQYELLMQCEFVLLAAEQLERARVEAEEQMRREGALFRDIHRELEEIGSNPQAADPERFARRRRAKAEVDATAHAGRLGTWFALQAILVSAANISKLLWGSGGKRARQRLALRESIGISDESPLKVLDIRDDFEHLDERVEEWSSAEGRSDYVGRNIGDGVHIAGEQERRGRRFGQYDPSSGIVTFWTHSVFLPDIIAEVKRIHPLLQAEVTKPSW
jgi:hypothetical protein